MMSTGRRTFRLTLAAVVVVAAACSSDDAPDQTTAPADPTTEAAARLGQAESGVADAEASLAESGERFCDSAEGYVEALDRYGKLFTDDAATVGDVETAGADLVEPRDTVSEAVEEYELARTTLAEAEQEVIDAQAALAAAVATASSQPISSTEPDTATTTTIVAPDVIERVEQAEADLARTGERIRDTTPLAEATAEYNSAAFALQIVWLQLLSDAGCFTDEQQSEALEQVTTYTAALQSELQRLGYYDGAIDGIYGPATVDGVKRLQADSGLTETGYVDRATALALDDQLAALDEQAATADATRTAAVQTALTVTGFWDGPIDGVWNDDLTAALQEFQVALGVEPTGLVDTATLAAFEQAIADRSASPVTTESPAPTAPVTTGDATGAEVTLIVAESELGQILTAADGMTVYGFTPDDQGVPTCLDSCAEQWPPLTVDDRSEIIGGDGIDASLLGTVEFPDGLQVSYNGWPLYFYAGDAAPGATDGQGQGGVWYVVDPEGNLIDGG